MALQHLLKNICQNAIIEGYLALFCTSSKIHFIPTRNKHYNPKFKRERANKFLKIKLPDFSEERREEKMSIEEKKAKLKERGITPFRPWTERPMYISSLGTIIDAYIPPEGDGKVSIISTPGVKQTYDTIGKKGKSYMALRKIRGIDYEFDIPTVAEKSKEIYIEALTAVANKNEDRLHELATEKAFPELMENVKGKVIKWTFGQALEPPRIVHIRVQEMVEKENMFAQITVRLFLQQKIVIYDRFGRLMHGSEDNFKDCLEYVVFEKHISNPYGSWRVHGKVVPSWAPPKQPIVKTFIMPPINDNLPALTPKNEVAELNTEKPKEISSS